MTHVLDSSAVLAWLFQERGEEVVDPVLTGATLTTTNLAEVCRRAEQRGYQRATADLAEDLVSAGLTLEETVTPADAVRAAELIRLSYDERDCRTRRGEEKTAVLSLGDGICIAVAERLGLPAMTSDRAWKDLENLFHTKVVLIR
ncbi:ribonuclease VapC [Kitasatospora sp. MAA4]|uniref:PIN domain-containing protein n=1 Tax=Kitasatospora sp. MAA4 TaxID=3035093 RepID=UPI00247565E7|nr:PIN domain-containing protein [Kitasatospora sp. MAA4]MDH6133911.1 ribonuclease VapC [Kitasatospora sp. MAA4]